MICYCDFSKLCIVLVPVFSGGYNICNEFRNDERRIRFVWNTIMDSHSYTQVIGFDKKGFQITIESPLPSLTSI